MTATRHPSVRGDLIPPFAHARVEELMRPGILSCHADAVLTEVADIMATHHIHAVVVTGMEGSGEPQVHRSYGLVCDIDVVRAASAGPARVTARQIARTDGITVDPATPLTAAARCMAERGTTHLVVVRDAQPVGVLSALDVAAALAWGGGAPCGQ